MQRVVSLALRLLAPLAFALLLIVPASARETIQSFTSNTILKADGSVDVTETIVVNAEGNEIRRGIYRDIPTVLINADQSRLRSDLTVLSVTKDGQPEPYSVENLGTNTQRIKIGDPDVFLDYRTYRYTIHYTMTRMARSFSDHDELFWNVTGNYWVFPILKVTATIQLPPGAQVQKAVGYTGRPGSLEQAVEISPVNGSTITVRATRELRGGTADGTPSEGLSVAVAFQKGILTEPQGFDKVLYWLSDHRDLILPSIAVLLVLAYNLFAWNAVGRDPAKGTIIPLFHAPKGFSPALVHYINHLGWKQSGWTAFTASIFDLGVKGLVTIEKAGKEITVKATGKHAEQLPSGEAGLFTYFNSQGEVTIDKTTGPKINEKRGELIAKLESENRQVYFKNNFGYVAIGLLIAALAIGGMVLTGILGPSALILAAVAGVIVAVFGSLFSGFSSSPLVTRFVLIAVFLMLGGNFLGGIVGFFTEMHIDPPLIGAISVVAITVIFAILMRAPTVQGRKIMDEIDGFKMYLDTAEKNRLNFVAEPPMTVSRFEAILPFAIALGVEKPWSTRFEGELARNAVSDARGGSYVPLWYAGSDWHSSSGGFSNSVSAVASGMSAAMISAQPSSSSSSGFSGGGGGGSGGGGGGGGGGGW